MLASRLVKYERARKNGMVNMVIEVQLPFTSSPPLSTPYLRLLGHCDVGPLADHPDLAPLAPPEHRSTTLEVHSLYVHPTVQRTGCAQRLFVQAVSEGVRLFPHCTRRMVVITFLANKKGRGFYEKMGGQLHGFFSGYNAFGCVYDVACYEWLEVEAFVRKWEKIYL